MARDECCYLCNECPITFPTLDELENHMTSDHVTKKANLIKPEDQQDEEGGDESFVKIEMDEEEEIKMEMDMNEIEEHIAGHSPTSSDSSNMSDVDENSSTVGATPPLFTGARIAGHSCRICGRAFSDRGQLNVHYTHTHRDKPQYECEHCQAVFCVKRELSTHLRIHSGEQPHKCDICGKEFGTRQLLKKHNMWHSGERSHVCQTCGKAFFQKGHLTQHLMIHKGGRPHRCTQCDKTFIFKFDLNRHMKIHLERGHSCSKCGKSFLKQISLDEHIAKCKRATGSPSTRTSTPMSDISRQESPTPVSIPRKMSNTPIQIPVSQSQIASPFQTVLNTVKEKSPSEGTIAPPSLPLFNNPFFATQLNSEDQNKIAQNLMAHYQNEQATQQRLLMMTAAQRILNLNQQNIANQQAAAVAAQGLFCALCNKQYPNAPAYAIHWSLMHIKNDSNQQQQMEDENELKLNVAQKTEEMLNVHSDTATSSSCASSPQKISPISTTTENDQHHHASCLTCDQYQAKFIEIEKKLHEKTEELRIAREALQNSETYAFLRSTLQQQQQQRHQPPPIVELEKLWALHYNN
jgi:DNA-directed RNA polymerase subunit RPC12/RpoP